MQKFNATHSKIIESLAIYKFLTYSQMVRLGISKQKPYLSRNMKLLLEKKYVARLDFGVDPTRGKLESFFYLLGKAKTLLMDEWGWNEEKIKLPIGRSSFFSKDYQHRKGTIDIQINVYQKAEQDGNEVLFFNTYYDKVGSANNGSLKALTSVSYGQDQYLIADAIFMLKKGENLDLYAVEYHRGIDSKRMLRTIEQYGRVLAEGSLSLKHGLNKNAKVLCVFEKQVCLEATKERFMNDSRFESLRELFLFMGIQS
ncbi:replication-relaxation family protein [Aureispira sp. CCB-QB1]|uniref:replication-relaxation family protein n=1 Tax=Aureispira sp. CCB-QB1 TaxID=1313421 RepID=UPI0006962469|nr:replication-relaxation family protein [Aureispira sp. CCB-QB1]